MEEAVERYSVGSAGDRGSLFLANAHRQAARWPRKRLGGTAIESAPSALTREMQADLAAALKEYTLLIEKLSADRDGIGGSDVARGILRNSYFAKADVLFDQGSSRCPHRLFRRDQPLSARAGSAGSVRANCRVLPPASQDRGGPWHARAGPRGAGTHEARRELHQNNPYSRDEWTRLLTWLSAL